jgi:ribonucleoside-diphosphate reductase beta chain
MKPNNNQTYNLLNPCTHYQTFSQYQWSKQVREQHIAMHWEVNQLNHTRTKREFYDLPQEVQETFMRILQFFTQADTCVCNNYIDNLMQIFKGQDVNAMLCDFANRENIHVESYAKLVETLSLSQKRINGFFTEYTDIKSMQDKNDFLNKHSLQKLVHKIIKYRLEGVTDYNDFLTIEDKQEIMRNLACFGAFTEGLQLYSSFAILFEPSRGINGGNLQGVSDTIEWSLKDEALHVEAIIQLFHEFKKENPDVWSEDMKKELYTICGAIVHFEDAFIDYVFEPCNGKFMTITADKVKEYIRYVADIRLTQLGLKPEFRYTKNPLPFMDEILNIGISNFFEGVVTDYAHNATTGNWDNCNY